MQSGYGKYVFVVPCRLCGTEHEQPGTTTWWGLGKYSHMTDKTTDNEPAMPLWQPSWQPWQPEGADSEEEQGKLSEKLDANPAPVMPLDPAAASNSGAGASTTSPIDLIDLTDDNLTVDNLNTDDMDQFWKEFAETSTPWP